MLPKHHIILGIFFCLILYFFNFSFFRLVIIFLSSVLIDIDHYLWYAFGGKTLSLKEAYAWFVKTGKYYDSLPEKQRKKLYVGVFPFHSIEFLLPLFILGFASPILLFIFIGFIFHSICDLLSEIWGPQRATYKISIIYTLIKRKFIGFGKTRFNRRIPSL